MLEQVQMVLVGPSHTGNIGSAARAMKTMGLSQLVLVAPQSLPDEQAYALAAGGGDILANARIVATLDEAIADCSLVIGSSARSRTLSWPMLAPREAADQMVMAAKSGPVALVFGRERTGLTNDELQKCHYHVAIAANPEYSSLNLAMAVQIFSYEIRMSWLQRTSLLESVEAPMDYPSAAQLDGFYQHLEQTLIKTGFITRDHPGHVVSKLRRLFNRARPESVELNILRGILTSIDKSTC